MAPCRRLRPGHGGLRTWLLTLVHHQAINQVHRQPIPGQMAVLDEGLRDAWQPEGWRVAYDNIRRQDIRGALAELPAEQRTAVELAFFGGLVLPLAAGENSAARDGHGPSPILAGVIAAACTQ